MKNVLKHKSKIIIGAVIVAVLALAFWQGGNAPSHQNGDLTEMSDPIHNQTSADKNTENVEASATEENQDTEKEYQTDSVAEAEKDNQIADKNLTCTLSVRCDTILSNMNLLKEEKVDIVPENGIVFAEKEVTFYEGESVFNVLLREMKRHKIHFEFVNTPVYNTAYIKGIANIYEFDCGNLSGWLYRVNGKKTEVGCSQYILKNGDKIELVYTCDMGKDIEGGA